MANLTLAQMRARIQVLVPDAGVANADVDSVIQTAHEVFPMEYFIDAVDETVTLATDTYEYNLPATVFALIRTIWMESTTAGLFDQVIPKHLWRPTLTQIVFASDFIPISGRKLRIEGQTKYTKPAADTDVITLHNGWVIQYATGLLHAAQGGSDSSMATWHQRMASLHLGEAQKIEDNINGRAKPDSVLVPGVS